MKNTFVKYLLAIVIAVGIIIIVISVSISWHPPAYEPIKMYNRSGAILINPKIFMDTITATGGNAFSVDISAASFSSVKMAVAIPLRNTATFAQMPYCHLKSLSTSAAVFNIIQPDFTGETILGIPVFGGDGIEFVPASSVVLQIFVFGN